MPTLLETVVSNTLAAGVLAVLAFAASRLRRPALAHGLWLLVLLKLVTPPLIPVTIPAFGSEPASDAVAENRQEVPAPVTLDALTPEELVALLAIAETPAPAPAAPEPAEPVSAPSWYGWLIPLWLGGSVLWLGLTCGSVTRFRRLLRSARRAPAGLQNEARALASRLGLARSPTIWLVPGAVSPMIWTVGAAPRLVFPTGLLQRLSAEQRSALLLHELAHVRRRDHWVRLVELLIGALYWWHPLVWLARRELREAEEQCCDAWVVWASGGEGHAYARALLEAVAFVSHTRCPLPAAASGIGPVTHLRRRLTMIMQGNTPRSLSALGWLAVLTLGLCLLPIAAQAQVPDKNDAGKEEIKALKEKLRKLEQAQRDQARKQAQAARQAEKAAREALNAARFDEQVRKDVIVQVQQDDGNRKAKAAVAELKQMIAIKRKELQDLEAKLNSVLATMDGKKGGKIKEKVKGKDGNEFRLELDLSTPEGAKHLAEQIEKAIKVNPDLMKLKQLEHVKGLKLDPKQFEELKKLGNIDIEIKNLEELKKLGQIKQLELKKLDEMKKKGLTQDLNRAIELKFSDDKLQKGKTRKTDDLDARLNKLMKEIEALRREIHQNKGKQAQ